jgi:hypothetical protein
MHSSKKKLNKKPMSFMEFKKKQKRVNEEKQKIKTGSCSEKKCDQPIAQKNGTNLVLRKEKRGGEITRRRKPSRLPESFLPSKVKRRKRRKTETQKISFTPVEKEPKYNAGAAGDLNRNIMRTIIQKNNPVKRSVHSRSLDRLDKDTRNAFDGNRETKDKERTEKNNLLPTADLKINNENSIINNLNKKKNKSKIKNKIKETITSKNLNQNPKLKNIFSKNENIKQEMIPREKQNFFTSITRNQGHFNPYTFTHDKLKAPNLSTSINNLHSHLNCQFSEDKIESEINFIISDIKSKFEDYLKGKIIKDKYFSKISEHVSDYFRESSPESWSLGFETFPGYYQMKSKIGTFSKRNYYSVTQVLSGEDLVIENILKSEECPFRVRKEVEMLEAMQTREQSHVVRFYEKFEDPHHFYLAFENPQNYGFQTLSKFKFEEKSDNLKEMCDASFQRSFLLGMLRAVEYVHSCGIVHRNLSQDCIYFDGNKTFKISNFSNSSIKNQSKKLIGEKEINLEEVAPELLKNKSLSDPKSDIWSCGKIFVDFLEKWGVENTIPGDLMQGMLDPNPKSRFSLKTCLKHPHLNNENQVNCKSKTKSNKNIFSDNIIKTTTEPSNCNQINENKNSDSYFLGEIVQGTPQKKQDPFAEPGSVLKDESTFCLHQMKGGAPELTEIVKETQKHIVIILIMEYLNTCGVPIEYLEDVLDSGKYLKFSYFGACIDILIKDFIFHLK